MKTKQVSYWFQFSLVLILVPLIFLSCQGGPESPSTGMTASDDGVAIQYQVAGLGSPVLVFVHCWCCHQSFWDAQVPYFAQKQRVVTLDLAGHGGSGADREKWTIPSFGRDVVSVVDKLDLEQMILVGHSMGGPVILEAARHMPERVIGLVGVDNFQDMGERWPQEELDKFLAAMRADFEGTTRNFVLTMFPPAADSVLVGRVAADPTKSTQGCYEPTLAEMRDGRETIDWIAEQGWFDGRLGLVGSGYAGFAAWAALCGAAKPVSAMVVAFGAREPHARFYPGGAFALADGLRWGTGIGERAAVARRRLDLERGLAFRPVR